MGHIIYCNVNNQLYTTDLVVVIATEVSIYRHSTVAHISPLLHSSIQDKLQPMDNVNKFRTVLDIPGQLELMG